MLEFNQTLGEGDADICLLSLTLGNKKAANAAVSREQPRSSQMLLFNFHSELWGQTKVHNESRNSLQNDSIMDWKQPKARS